MERAIISRPEGQVTAPNRGAGIGAGGIAGIALGALVLGIVLSQLPDLIRYFRIASI